jgi:hypothetical protein
MPKAIPAPEKLLLPINIFWLLIAKPCYGKIAGLFYVIKKFVIASKYPCGKGKMGVTQKNPSQPSLFRSLGGSALR